MMRLLGSNRIFSGIVATLMLAAIPSVHGVEILDIGRNTLSVTGQGKTKVMATVSDVELGVEVQGKSAQEVQQALAKQMQPVVDLLQKEKVDKLQTDSLSISPQYSRDTPSYVTGYTGYNSVNFSVPSARAGDLIDRAIKAGANRLQNLTQRPEEAVLAEARQSAIKKAAGDAMAQINAVLESLNLKKRSVVKVVVAPFGGAPAYYGRAYKSLSVEASQAPTSILPEEQEVQASMTLDIEFQWSE